MVKPITRSMYEACMFDCWPDSLATLVDFGLDGWGAEDTKDAGQKRYEALNVLIRAGEITLEQLDDALGDGPKLTALVNGCPSNPHKGIVFATAYDGMGEEEDE